MSEPVPGPAQPEVTLAKAEEWVREFLSHGYRHGLQIDVLMRKYDRRGDELAENVGVMNALRRHRDDAEAEVYRLRAALAANQAVVEAGVALVRAMNGEPEIHSLDQFTTEVLALAAAVAALPGHAGGKPTGEGKTDAT